jgi:hypothetical protein
MKVPQEISSFTEDMDVIDSRNKHTLWKVKAKASLIVYHIISGYAWSEFVYLTIDNNPAFFNEINELLEWDDDFSKEVLKEHFKGLLDVSLNIIYQTKTNFVGTKCLAQALKLVAHCITTHESMEYLKTIVNEEFFQVMLHIMLVTHKDTVLFKEDPIEFERKQMDLFEVILDPQ